MGRFLLPCVLALLVWPSPVRAQTLTEPHELLLTWSAPARVYNIAMDPSGDVLVNGGGARAFSVNGVLRRTWTAPGGLVCSSRHMAAGPGGTMYVSDHVFATAPDCPSRLHLLDASGTSIDMWNDFVQCFFP